MKIMKFGRTICFARVPYNRPGTFAGSAWDHSDTYEELLVINFRVLVFNVFDTPEVMTGPASFKCYSGSTGSFTSLSGGNQVDGLPPASSFGFRRNFSIFIWLVI